MCPQVKISVRQVAPQSEGWEQVQALRAASYDRHPLHYKPTGAAPACTGETLGAFDQQGRLLCSMRLHNVHKEGAPPQLRSATEELLADLKLPNAFLIDKFVAIPEVMVHNAMATFAVCTAVLLLAANKPKGEELKWAVAFAQKPLARRYTRAYGFKSLSEKEWQFEELSENSYFAVGGSLANFQDNPSTHPIFRQLITEGHPDVEFSPELGDKFPV